MMVGGPKLFTIILGHTHNTGYNPLWFIDKGSHCRVPIEEIDTDYKHKP